MRFNPDGSTEEECGNGVYYPHFFLSIHSQKVRETIEDGIRVAETHINSSKFSVLQADSKKKKKKWNY